MSDPNGIYDLRGLKCPLPVLKVRKRLASMPSGSELIVHTSDPLAVIDITHLCNQDGHALLESGTHEGAGNRFVIRKG